MSTHIIDDEDATGDATKPPTTKPPRRKRGASFPVVPLSEAARILKEAGKYGFEHPHLLRVLYGTQHHKQRSISPAPVGISGLGTHHRTR